MEFSKEQQLKMHDYLVFSRSLGEKIVEYIFSGKIAGAIHPSLGQEAVNAGIMAAVDFSDIKFHVSVTHRQQPVIAKKVGMEKFLGELLNRQNGLDGGTAGEYHVVSLKDGLYPGTGALGGAWAIATGYAWALKQQGKKNEVILVPYGDGATSEGPVYEAMNIAAINKVPILFLIENNGVAMSTPIEKESPVKNLSVRAAACGMKGITVDGNDVEAVTEAILHGLKLAALNEPNLVELKTWRWEGHYVGDDQSKYRDVSFRDNLDLIDPVKKYEKKLLKRCYVDEEYIKKVHNEKNKFMEDAFGKALTAEFPTRDQVLDYDKIYSNNAGGEI